MLESKVDRRVACDVDKKLSDSMVAGATGFGDWSWSLALFPPSHLECIMLTAISTGSG